MTTFLLNKMCLENEKKSGKRRFTTFFQKTTVLLPPNWCEGAGIKVRGVSFDLGLFI